MCIRDRSASRSRFCNVQCIWNFPIKLVGKILCWSSFLLQRSDDLHKSHRQVPWRGCRFATESSLADVLSSLKRGKNCVRHIPSSPLCLCFLQDFIRSCSYQECRKNAQMLCYWRSFIIIINRLLLIRRTSRKCTQGLSS